ncbi:BUD13 homolog [Cylas formicarius]|uniref:BUD13 homolog n=1 Tax=Cylas formicarius TaxID=197179 RepID=UPI002958B6F9|nr:BUD13 homolog [Cylas formicarius]
MTTIINQKEYLKKYLGKRREPGEKKRKKKKPKVILSGLKIVDDNVDIKLDEEIKIDLQANNEEAPQIVAVIDDRPPSLRIDEKTRNKLWKPIGETNDSIKLEMPIKFEGGFKLNKLHTKMLNSPPHSHSNSHKVVKQEIVNVEYDDHSPSHAENKLQLISRPIKEEDVTPPRSQFSDNSPQRKESNRDISPLRKRKTRFQDISPPPVPKDNFITKNEDNSPPRRISRDMSPPRKPFQGSSLKSTTNSSRWVEDNSPPHRKQGTRSPQRKIKDDIDSLHYKTSKGEDRPPSRRIKQGSPDKSPPRRPRSGNRDESEDNSPPRRHRHDNRSPPCKLKWEIPSSSSSRSHRSPSKKRKYEIAFSSSLGTNRNAARSPARDSCPPTFSKNNIKSPPIVVTQEEAENSPNKTVVVRRKANQMVDPEEQERRLQKEKENKEKYDRWGKGLKQVEAQGVKIAEELHEMSKPLARYADDEDLEKYLKEQEREGDPMLAYIRKKKKKVAIESGKPMKPQFEGEYMPNRFLIAPGYRWDGVDRSNGYEKKYFDIQNSRKADVEESYKWSTEDM